MSSNKFLVCSVATLSIMFAGAVAAQGARQNINIHIYGQDTPDTSDVPTPVADPRKQARTERMLREQERQAAKEYPRPRVTPEAPDMKKLEKTERMLRAQEEMAKDEPR